MFGTQVVHFEIANVQSSNKTYGHRVLSPSQIKIKSAKEFFKTIQKNGWS